MAGSGVCKAGGIVEDAEDFNGESIEVGVESLLVGGIAKLKCAIEEVFEFVGLLVGDFEIGRASCRERE